MEQKSFAGMTVNERLFHLGLIEAFDAAARSRDGQGLVKVLIQAKFSDEEACRTAAAVMENPKLYGC